MFQTRARAGCLAAGLGRLPAKSWRASSMIPQLIARPASPNRFCASPVEHTHLHRMPLAVVVISDLRCSNRARERQPVMACVREWR